MPTFSAVGADFANGLFAIGSAVARNRLGRRIDGISRQPEAARDPRGVPLLSLDFVESMTLYGLVIVLALLFANPLIE